MRYLFQLAAVALPGLTCRAVASGSLVLVTASCATPDGVPQQVRVSQDIEVRVHLSEGGPWARQDEFDHAAQALAGQVPAGLDGPLQLRRAQFPVAPPQGAEVTLRFGINTEGYLIQTQLKHLGSTMGVVPPASLGLMMMRSLPTWRFDPPMKGQQPVNFCCVSVTFD